MHKTGTSKIAADLKVASGQNKLKLPISDVSKIISISGTTGNKQIIGHGVPKNRYYYDLT